MFYALVHYPQIETKHINSFRQKYDPHADLIGPHITFMFLVPESIGEAALINHIDNILSRWRPFPVHLKGLHKSWDHWLFLILAEGKDDVILLHRDLYTGILAEYHRPDIGFIPHLGLGLFAKRESNYDIRDPREVSLDVESYSLALRDAQQLDFDYHCEVDRLHLVKISDDISEIEWSKEFRLRS
jgi:2'-5' RNA ligase